MIYEIITIIIAIVAVITLAIVFEINIKKIKEIGMKKELNELANKYPGNKEICKEILKKVNNENISIEENLNSSNCLYIALQNKILIGDTKESYTRIQTIAHECLHSIQERKILIFNYIYSNIYIISFIISIIMIIFKVFENELIYTVIFLILSLIYYSIRIYLENDAMIKAKFLAKEYMESKNILTEDENKKIINGYDELNNLGIKCVNFNFFMEILIKVIILNAAALIF